jgi:hypothetical protein
MTDVTSAPAVDSSPAPAQDTTPRDLADIFASARNQPSDDAPEAAAPEPELAQANADPQTEAPGETTETTEPAEELPPIEPPRSWTQAEKERFQSLPRETQEYLHNREQEREREFRRGQNELAEQRKAIEAEREAADKARQEYEAKLPALMQAMHESSPFADIKSMADVEKMQAEDPFRFQQFQVYQWKMQGVQAELQQAEQRKAHEAQTEWASYTKDQDTKFIESLSDADKPKIADLMKEAPEFLVERGFKDQELAELWHGNKLFRDHRVQSLILDAMKYRNVQKAKVVAAAKPAPQVQRPGTAKPQGSAQSETITKLSAKLERSGDHRDLGALIGALRRA